MNYHTSPQAALHLRVFIEHSKGVRPLRTWARVLPSIASLFGPVSRCKRCCTLAWRRWRESVCRLTSAGLETRGDACSPSARRVVDRIARQMAVPSGGDSETVRRKFAQNVSVALHKASSSGWLRAGAFREDQRQYPGCPVGGGLEWQSERVCGRVVGVASPAPALCVRVCVLAVLCQRVCPFRCPTHSCRSLPLSAPPPRHGSGALPLVPVFPDIVSSCFACLLPHPFSALRCHLRCLLFHPGGA